MKVTEHLVNDGILTLSDAERIQEFERHKPMSVHWELKTILYLGILLFMTGLGILVYLNIDTIGHTAIIAAMSLACGACFYYGIKHRKPYSNGEVKNESPLFDYVILLGCLLFGLLIAYTEYQYAVFGGHYGLATLVPATLFMACAYLFDHKGVLSLGITAIAATAGITVTPLYLLESDYFSGFQIIITSIVVGLVLAAFTKIAETKNIKKHFGFTYNNFAANMIFIATLAGLFDQEGMKFLYFIFLAAMVFYYIRYAINEKSFLFLLLSILYGYIGLTYAFFSLIIDWDSFEAGFMLGLAYVVSSCVGIVLFFIYYKRILGIKK